MEIRKLEAFAKVVELNSFSRAAEAILLTQPTVSQHIRDLELEFQQKLLDRLGHEVVATPAGRLLYRYAKKILQTRQEAIEAVGQYGVSLAGRINIGCGTIPGTYILPKLMGKFKVSYPTIKTTLRINSSHFIAKQVIAGELELGVIGAKWHEASLDWIKLFSDELVLALPPGHPWAKLPAVSLAKIASEPFILREQGSGTRKTIAQFLATVGLKETDLQEVAEVGSTAAIKEAVKRNVGISILSKLAIMNDVENGDLATVALQGIAMQRSFYLISRKNRELLPGSKMFKDYLLSDKNGGDS
ncbi:MAG: LysR family transcriptional regulator [Desulfuromonadales bacterium]|nr:LysR family transcriptional regulator [Desulfuromonadales bacterium]